MSDQDRAVSPGRHRRSVCGGRPRPGAEPPGWQTPRGRVSPRLTTPPAGVWTGRSAVVQGWTDGGFGSEAFGSMRRVVTRANGQPAVAGHVRKPGDAAYEPPAIDVLRVQDGIVTFDGAVFEHVDLPATLGAAVGTR